jgi:hypothetical protein
MTIDDFVTALDAHIRWYNDVHIYRSLAVRSAAVHPEVLGTAA